MKNIIKQPDAVGLLIVGAWLAYQFTKIALQ